MLHHNSFHPSVCLLHYIITLSAFARFSARPLLFDLPSLQPLLSQSLGFSTGEASLSVMTVGLLPARPPLWPPAKVALMSDRGSGIRGGLADWPATSKQQSAEICFSSGCCVGVKNNVKFGATPDSSCTVCLVEHFWFYRSLWLPPGPPKKKQCGKDGHSFLQYT